MRGRPGKNHEQQDQGWDSERELRLGLHKLFGKDGGEILAKGLLNYATPINLASRLDLKDIYFREPFDEKEGRDAAEYYMASILGPTTGQAMKLAEAIKLANDGYLWRASEAALPKIAADQLKAIRLAQEGATTRKGTLISDMKWHEVAAQSLGFSSSRLARKYDENSYIMDAQEHIKEARSKVMGKLVDAFETNDDEALKKGYLDWEDWNKRHPEYPITKSNLKQSAGARARNKARMTGIGININPKLDYLADKYAID